jgi:hypothetical protein
VVPNSSLPLASTILCCIGLCFHGPKFGIDTYEIQQQLLHLDGCTLRLHIIFLYQLFEGIVT